MKFTVAWANTLAQNVSLKVAVVCLSLIAGLLAITTAKLSLKKPLIVERACYSKALDTVSNSRTSSDVDAFIRKALSQRFDSDATPSADYLSVDETATRTQEQKELTSRNMTQTVLVRSVKADGDSITVDSDRIISVGQIRSALIFPLSILIATTTRTENNPYGLQVIRVSIPKPVEHK